MSKMGDAIKNHCRDCQGVAQGGPMREVEACTAGPDSKAPCALWTFRMGKNPGRKGRRPEAALAALARLREQA